MKAKKAIKTAGKIVDNALLAGAVTNYTGDGTEYPKKKFDLARFLGQLVPLILALKEIIDVIKN